MGKKRNNRNASTPATETTEATEVPGAIENTAKEAAEEAARLKAEKEATSKSKPAAEDQKVFWVEGYGNVNAKSQAEAEKKAKKILEEQRRP